MLLEVLEYWVDVVKSLINLLPDLGPCEDNLKEGIISHNESVKPSHLPTDKDEENNPRLDHPVDEAREQLRLIAGELGVGEDQALQADGELHITGTNLRRKRSPVYI